MPRETTLPEPWLSAAEHVGGPIALADALHMSRAALWRLAHGTRQPSALVANTVNAWFRRRRLKEPFP